ncbi:MAG: FAD-dependent oxidoreductase [Alkalicoccus sp.]|nr:MAG: FAD-dependent oxidoreductase [Alkalicoccus sp.]
MTKYDLVVIGGGAGGMTTAAGAASLGAGVALIEKRAELGGDCLHYGCVPSKALIEAANDVFKARKAQTFGLAATGTVDLKKINQRVKKAIAHIQEHDSIERFTDLGVHVFHGTASFVDNHHVQVNDEKLYGNKIVVAVGSRADIAPIEGLEDTGYISNETVFDLTELPERMVFIGGGLVGLEIAQAFARLGTSVTVLEGGPAVLGKEDRDIQKKAVELLEKELTIVVNAKIIRCARSAGGRRIDYMTGGEEYSIEADRIFVSTGRKPNTDNLELERAGVKMDERGFIQVDDTLRTAQPHIFAVGDVNGSYPFTHVAGLEGKLVVQNALFHLKRKISYAHVPWNTYITPEIFHFGRTQQEAAKAGDVFVYTTPLSEVDRFTADEAEEGFVKVITDKKGSILGAHAIGKGAGDWMQVMVLAAEQNLKIGDLSQMLYPYPNHAAAIERLSNAYWRNKLFSGIVPKLTAKVIKWLP